MVNNIGVTEFQMQAQAKWRDYDQQASHPATKDESSTDHVVHDSHVMQGIADGHISIIGHGSQEKKFSYTKKISKKYLTDKVIICYCLVTWNYLGIQVDINEISMKEKFCRKKYMAVFR